MFLVLYIIVDQEVRDSPALRPIETERPHAQDSFVKLFTS